MCVLAGGVAFTNAEISSWIFILTLRCKHAFWSATLVQVDTFDFADPRSFEQTVCTTWHFANNTTSNVYQVRRFHSRFGVSGPGLN